MTSQIRTQVSVESSIASGLCLCPSGLPEGRSAEARCGAEVEPVEWMTGGEDEKSGAGCGVRLGSFCAGVGESRRASGGSLHLHARTEGAGMSIGGG
jgi:hypothetical protein